MKITDSKSLPNLQAATICKEITGRIGLFCGMVGEYRKAATPSQRNNDTEQAHSDNASLFSAVRSR